MTHEKDAGRAERCLWSALSGLHNTDVGRHLFAQALYFLTPRDRQPYLERYDQEFRRRFLESPDPPVVCFGRADKGKTLCPGGYVVDEDEAALDLCSGRVTESYRIMVDGDDSWMEPDFREAFRADWNVR